jgi:hypothetical protein
MPVMSMNRPHRFDGAEAEVDVEYSAICYCGEIEIEVERVLLDGLPIAVTLEEENDYVDFICIHHEDTTDADAADRWYDEQREDA